MNPVIQRENLRIAKCRGGWQIPAPTNPTTMPNYDYQCEKCGHRFEIFQSMNDAKLADCPVGECDGTVKRLLGTGAGLIFKGAGFYQTDHRSASYQAGAKSESSGGSGGDGGVAKKSETAPASTAAPKETKAAAPSAT